jgi:DNA-binding NtrC family response regulator
MPLTGCRVLIIEDEYYIATDLAGALTDYGATVIGPVSELSEAMAQVRREGFDVAMLDINLRGNLAYSVADELLRLRIPFGFATGYSAELIPDRFGDVKSWEKPYALQEIINDLKELCGSSKSQPKGR